MLHVINPARAHRCLKLIGSAALMSVIIAAASPASAQDSYPSKPVTLIVGSSAGGGGDIVARAVADRIEPLLGQPVIVDNRPGASGNIAAEIVAKSPPDGYQLLLAYTGHVINPALFRSLPFDPITDFTPVTMFATNTTVLIVPAGSPYKTARDLIDTGKADPGSLNFGTMLGTSQHLAAALFGSLSGLEFQTIPYKGNGEAMQDLLGGRLDFMFSTLQASQAAIKAGSVRAIAVTGQTRSKLLPDVPTIAESGVEGFNSVGWYGFLAPKDTPQPIVEKLYEATRKALDGAELSAAMASMGNESTSLTPAEFQSFIAAEVPRWQKLVTEIGLEQQ